MRALALAVLVASSAAVAQGSMHGPGGISDTAASNNSHMISGFVFAPWYYGFGIGLGGRYTLPLAPKGLIDTVNDSVELEFGGDFWYAGNNYFGVGYSYTALGIPVEARWTFHVTDKFDLYAKLGLGLLFQFCSVNGYGYCSAVGPYIEGGPGLLYKLSDKLWLRAEGGYTGLRVGLGIAL